MRKCTSLFSALAIAACVAATPGSLQAAIGPVTFGSDADYNNASPATTGLFRDIVNGANINRGTTGSVTSLNFTQQSNGLTLYDETPIDGSVKSILTDTSFVVSADLYTNSSNIQGGSVVALFNEGAGKTGIAFGVTEAGNTDPLRIWTISQTGTFGGAVHGGSLYLASTGNTNWQDNTWYRVEMTISITAGTTLDVTGRVFTHTNGADPSSPLGLQLGSTLTYNGTLGSGLLSGVDATGEIGMGFDTGTLGSTTYTNFYSSTVAVPEPTSLAVLGIAVMGLIARKPR